ASGRPGPIECRTIPGPDVQNKIRLDRVPSLVQQGLRSSPACRLGWTSTRTGCWRICATPSFGFLPLAEALSRVVPDAHRRMIMNSPWAGLLFGLLPAWSAPRGDIAEALREYARTTTTGTSRSHLRSFLVTAELALALILLAGAGLLIKGFLRLRSVDPGFNPANVITMYLQLPGTRYPQISLQTNFRRELLARINTFPRVEAPMITDLPL